MSQFSEMNKQDSPFAAIDKKLLFSSQTKKLVSEDTEEASKASDVEKITSLPSRQEDPQPISEQKRQQVATVSRHHDTTTPRHNDTVIPRHQEKDPLDKVRKSVRQQGKEAATHRFTQKEKNAIAEIIYRYKKQGIRTSENEITRISINYLLIDHQENGEASILTKILKSLNE